MRQYYYKATLYGGASGHDNQFIYKLGINIHPNPDKTNKDACGVGIHLAKTLKVAKKYVPRATEFYLAEAGVILGEDDSKVRCGSCNIIRQLTDREISEREFAETTEDEKIKLKEKMGIGFIEPLCGQEWFDKHWHDVTQDEIDNQRLVIKTNRRTINISHRLKPKAIKQILSTLRA